jgi:hypothetical protein
MVDVQEVLATDRRSSGQQTDRGTQNIGEKVDRTTDRQKGRRAGMQDVRQKDIGPGARQKRR